MLGNSAGAETAICTSAAGEVGTGLGFKMQRQAAGILPLPVLVPNVNRALALTTTGARQAVICWLSGSPLPVLSRGTSVAR